MSWECEHGDHERQLHHGFTGRPDLIDGLGRLLLEDRIDCCVALIGSAGIGKTAAVTHWVAQCRAGKELVACHHIRTQHGDKAEPRVIARSLARQVEKQFPDLRDPQARPEARLVQLLAKVSAQVLMPQGRRMVLVIDGLDERITVSELREVMSWLPRAPSGIRLLLAGRIRDRLPDLEGLCGSLRLVDLDDPGFAADHDAAVAGYWDREVGMLGLDRAFAEHAVRRANGSMLHAALLRNHVAGSPCLDHLDTIPRDVPSLLAKFWERVRDDRPAVRALEILCAAREPLALEQIGRVAGLSNPADLRGIVRVARDLLVDTLRGDGVTVYALFHEAVRSFLVELLRPIALRGLHGELADKLATWPLPSDPATRRYALRHAIAHRIAADDHEAIRALVGNIDFLEVKCREQGIDDVELDLRRAAEAAAAVGQMALHGEIDRLLRLLARESRALSRDTGVDTSRLWNRVRQERQPSQPLEPAPSRMEGHARGAEPPPAPPSISSAVIGQVMARPGGVVPSLGGRGSPKASLGGSVRPPLLGLLGMRGPAVTACEVTPDSGRVVVAYADLSIHIYALEGGQLLKRLTGHGATIQACVVSPDGRWLVSASADHTLKLWELESGDEMATLSGHTGPVKSCAVTPDGSRVVSASTDHTVKVWEVATARCANTFEGHTASVEDCAISPDGSWVVSASVDATLKFWSLERGNLLATYASHTDSVVSCAVAPDGRYVVSGSSDHTLKVWNLSNGSVTTTLKGHRGTVTGCVVAVDGRSVCSASSDASLRIWDVDTGHTITTLDEHTRPVTCCAITPNGRRLVSGSSDGTTRVWALDGNRTSTLPGGPPVTVIARSRTSAQTAPDKVRILFLAAKGSHQNTHTKEYAAIEHELQRTPHRDDFDLRSKWALTYDDMARYLLEIDPTIIHLRGAPMDTSASDVDTAPDAGPPGDSGIWLRDEQGGMQLVTSRALKMMVKTTAPSARLVVLNACYGDDHAAELCHVVDCVAGMARDHAHVALSFAVAFYRMLGYRKSVGEALDHARAMLAFKLAPDECAPRCQTRDWTDAHQIFLSPDLRTP